ncbi:proline-specific permease [Penicillium taxi]|uniref:proline-specific permease n=1 Tax=Penicillium taxi TaxID=168475 RepID=UPI0025454F0A|nr:proline-specific permease [Penicillium taxi]KAJ5899208.1 proline-specific permease [Penicillium taxi]
MIQMITVNTTLGTGLYWRGGQILGLGGPLAVLLSFLIVGLLSWAIMQCISEMACMWPVPGAMSLYVAKFIDPDLGTIVGAAYWFTYTVGFPTLIATSAAEFNFWDGLKDNKAFHGAVVYCLIPITIVGINAFRVEIYGWIEVVSGFLKIAFLFVIISALIAINSGALKRLDWDKPTHFDHSAADNWFTALLMSISIATFAFVGIEVAAASSLEAKWPKRSSESENPEVGETLTDEVPGRTIKNSAVYTSFWATLMYSLSGVLETFDISSEDCQLPRVSWLEESDKRVCKGSVSQAAFVTIAKVSKIPYLADVFNIFLIFTCLTCASTNLFVASRTLFGLTTRLDGSRDQPRYMRFFAWFGKTDRRQVPLRAVIGSAIFLSWVPFLQLIGGGENTYSPINTFIDVLGIRGIFLEQLRDTNICSVSKHRDEILDERIVYFPRSSNYYPYRSHFQPWLAYIALIGCLFLLLVANGAALWNGFHLIPFLSSYFTVLVFVGSWVCLKLIRGSRWSYVDLSDPQRVKTILQNLHYLAREARS